MKILTIAFILLSVATFGQGVKISDMPDASALGGTEYIPVVQSGANRKATPAQLSTYVNSQYGTGVVTWLTTPSWTNFNAAITGTAPYWPLSGSANISGNTSLQLDDGFILDLFSETSASGIYLNSDSGNGDAVNILGSDLTVTNQVEMVFDIDDFYGYSPSGGGVTILDSRSVQKGIEYSIPRDSTDWTPHTLTTKAYVDGKVASSAFWPLTGTADLTGNTVIDGNNFDLTFGSTNRLDDFSVQADNQVLINVAAGNDVNRVTFQPGISTFTLLDTDGMTVDVQILVQSGAADILRIVKDESVTVFEINADGSIVYGDPPTDCTGLATNTIWSDSGTLKLCP